MNEQEPILELYRGDILLAVLSNIQLWDWPWYSCDFQPTLEFEQYKALFDQELELLEDKGATEEWDTAYAKIENLELILSNSGQAKATQLFLLHVEGKRARFKAVFD